MVVDLADNGGYVDLVLDAEDDDDMALDIEVDNEEVEVITDGADSVDVIDLTRDVELDALDVVDVGLVELIVEVGDDTYVVLDVEDIVDAAERTCNVAQDVKITRCIEDDVDAVLDAGDFLGDEVDDEGVDVVLDINVPEDTETEELKRGIEGKVDVV